MVIFYFYTFILPVSLHVQQKLDLNTKVHSVRVYRYYKYLRDSVAILEE